ncbi:hypothetical protein OAP18_02655 [Gammaproteobacteria bacterium]|nr:hypothetical protein [Gammaproteobacteria bacterium]
MSVSHYLQHYAEAETILAGKIRFQYQHVLVIPAFNEPDNFLARVSALQTSCSVLVILILNAPDTLDDSGKIANTQRLGLQLKENYPVLNKLTSTVHLLELDKLSCQHLLLVERCHTRQFIPVKEGVGLARKIACDLACQLINTQKITSPWIHTSDADVSLPSKYFSAADSLDPHKVAAALYPFKHNSNPDTRLNLCQQLYELSLYYYVEGLAWAGSPYAFHTIGSTLLINHTSYALARGFPKRAAGEDFYLLNKLAKTGEIMSLVEPAITIDSRESDRVPFGTGPALTKISQLDHPLQDYLYYHPACFYYLKIFLALLPALWVLVNKQQHEPFEDLINQLIKEDRNIDADVMLSCLKSVNLGSALTHAVQHSKSSDTFLRHLHNWFDAFKTLKFIHYLRQEAYPSINAKNLITECTFLSSKLHNQFSRLK